MESVGGESMTLVPYQCDCDPKTVNKGRYIKKTIQGNSIDFANYEPLDDLNGYILVGSVPDSTNYIKINNINGRNRYYFVTSRERQNGGILKVNLHEDVLMTFNDEIRKLSAVIDRAGSTTKVQADINDSRPIKQYMVTSEHTFSKLYDDFYYGDPTNQNNYNFIVILSGRGTI